MEPEGTRENIFPNAPTLYNCSLGVKERAGTSSEPPDSAQQALLPHLEELRALPELWLKSFLGFLASVLSPTGLCWAALSDLNPPPGSTDKCWKRAHTGFFPKAATAQHFQCMVGRGAWESTPGSLFLCLCLGITAAEQTQSDL